MTLDNKTKIRVVNKRSLPYTMHFPSTGEYYEWMPASNGIEDEHELDFKQVQYQHMRSATFKGGFLFIDNEEARKRLGLEKDEIKVLTMSREDIEALLKGNMTTIKKLDKFKDNHGLIREVITIAKDLKIDNHNKLSYLSELSGIPVDIITETNNKE